MKIDNSVDFIKIFLEKAEDLGKINKKTLELYRKDIEDFDGYIYEKNLLDIEPIDIMNYIEKLKSDYSERSVNRKISSLRSFYRFLIKEKIIEKNPFLNIVLPDRVEKNTFPLERWEIKNILDICNESYEEKKDKMIIELLYHTGLKIGDILSLELEDLERVDYKLVTYKSGKNTDIKKLDIEISQKLRKYVEENKMYIDNNIFSGVTRENFRVRFKKYGKKAKIDRDITPSMIGKIKINEIEDEREEVKLSKIKEIYMKIGIGDE